MYLGYSSPLSPAITKLCEDTAYKSCKAATINKDVLGLDCFLLPGNVEVKLIEEKDNTYNYGANGTHFFGAFDPKTGALKGNANFPDGSLFTLDFVEGKDHVWREVDSETGKEKPVGYGDPQPTPSGYGKPVTSVTTTTIAGYGVTTPSGYGKKRGYN